ncbi:MAG: hypothetical protein JWM11_5188 [Planctomycetaceae bacterium]|nr:hypothetical protein [Planctomycetaceae bacterium]
MMNCRQNPLWRIGVAGLIAVCGTLLWTAQQSQAQDLAGFAARALKPGSEIDHTAVQELRNLGPEAVQYLLSHEELKQAPHWSEVLDTVAQQKEAQYSGLYWYTDLDQALQVARRDKKPVLSLRLLGKLTDELSCANSRFFRTTLYPNAQVRELLANHFVLHWQSVRAVPIITIDFGDGRQIKRTITGNSLHLVLDHQGRAVDVLPGLYGAGAFVRELQLSGPAAVRFSQAEGSMFQHQRAAYHQTQLNALLERWNSDCQTAKVTPTSPVGIGQDDSIWSKVALLYNAESMPTGAAQQAVAAAAPAAVAGRIAISKAVVENPILRQMRNLTQSISEDTVRNQYQLHFRIHTWFAKELVVQERELLVARVYSELFLSPLNDPWYGLSKPDTYSAIKADGRIDAVSQNTRR